MFVRLEWRTIKKRHALIQHAEVPRDFNVLGGGVRQPESVVGNPRANTLAQRRKPPVLDISFHELSRGCAQEMLARDLRLCDAEGDNVLKLIAESIRTTGLIECGSRPDTTGKCLIEEPAVH